MSKEHGYVHESGVESARFTPAQRAFFDYQYVLGSYEYTRRHGPDANAQAFGQELNQRYERYRTLRDHPKEHYVAGDAPAARQGEQVLFLRERPPFDVLRATQEALGRQGYYFTPVEREHAEGLAAAPLLHRLRSHIKKRGFAKVAGHTIITFTGYETDPREVYEIPELRAYYRKLDAELPELPALPAYLPELGFNGPGLYLLLLGEVEQAIHHPEQ